MRRKQQPPLRRIVARKPDKYRVDEKLECGHWHASYQDIRDEEKAKRRRCHECLHPRKPAGISWSMEGGTAGQYQWFIQRKTGVIL